MQAAGKALPRPLMGDPQRGDVVAVSNDHVLAVCGWRRVEVDSGTAGRNNVGVALGGKALRRAQVDPHQVLLGFRRLVALDEVDRMVLPRCGIPIALVADLPNNVVKVVQFIDEMFDIGFL